MTPEPQKNNLRRKALIGLGALLAAALLAAAVLMGIRTTKAPASPADQATVGHKEAPGHAEGEHHGQENARQHQEAGSHADAEHHDAPTQGEHGGSLFRQGSLGVEVQLAEEGEQPRLRVWLYDKDQPLDPAEVSVRAVVKRLTGGQQALTLEPAQGGLLSREPVAEPHALDIEVTVQAKGQDMRAVLSKEEGKVDLSEQQIQASAITIAQVAPGRIQSVLDLPGEIRLNEDRTSHVVPRIAGVVESVRANLGQVVRKGDVLAVIASPSASEQRSEWQTAQKRLALARTTYQREKLLWEQKVSAEQDYQQARQAVNEAEVAVANARQKLSALGLSIAGNGGLNRFELRAPFNGVIIEKHLSLGEAVQPDAAAFTVSDLSQVWVELKVPAKELPQVRVGEKVTIKASAFDASASGTITFVGALIGEQTRTATARVVLDNPKGAWRPGLFVSVQVVAAEVEAPITVNSEAIQTVDDKPVVFVRVKGGFVAQPVQLGSTDGQNVQVLQGLAPGASYASTGSFVIKSELGKDSAEHTH